MATPANLEKALAYLQAADIPAHYKKLAPLQKILWKKGIAVPPAILADFKTNAISFGIINGIIWLLLNLLIPLNNPQTPAKLLFSVLFFAVFTGCWLAAYFRRQRRKLGLRTWQEIQNLPDEPDASH
jgi:hypothetical protein